jgi:uncharacterized protein YggE
MRTLSALAAPAAFLLTRAAPAAFLLTRAAPAAVLLALALPAPALADGPARLVTVTGEATVQAAPDIATITLGVTTEGATAAEAMGANTAALARVFDRLRAAGIAERDMQTSNLSVNPNWQQVEANQPARVVGYVASNMVTVRVRVLESLGAVLDAAVSDGANSMNGLSFGLAEPRAATDSARAAAVADAVARATLLVEAAGAKLGPVVSITEGGSFQPPMPMFRAEADAASAPVPVAAGEVGVSVSVTVVFEIAG